MKSSYLILLGAVAVGALSGCATSLPVTPEDRGLTLSTAEVFPTLPERARSVESLRKLRWPDGTVDLAYVYRGRHDGLPVMVYSSVSDFPDVESAMAGRAESDIDHRRLLISLEQREANTFVDAGPDATTHLLFAGMRPVGMRFSTRMGAQTVGFVCLAPPQFFDAHRTAELLQERVERVERKRKKNAR